MAEKKQYRSYWTEQPVSSAIVGNTWLPLADIPQGIDNYQRSGREVRLHKLKVRVALHNNAATAQYVRLVIGYISDFAITPSTTFELFEPLNPTFTGPLTGTAIGGGNGVLATVLEINKSKMQVIYDKVHVLGCGTSVDGTESKYFEIVRNLRDKKILYEAASVGDKNQSSQLYMGVWNAETANDTAGGTLSEITAVSTIDYLDL